MWVCENISAKVSDIITVCPPPPRPKKKTNPNCNYELHVNSVWFDFVPNYKLITVCSLLIFTELKPDFITVITGFTVQTQQFTSVEHSGNGGTVTANHITGFLKLISTFNW